MLLFDPAKLNEQASQERFPIRCNHCHKTFQVSRKKIKRILNPKIIGETGYFCSKECGFIYRAAHTNRKKCRCSKCGTTVMVLESEYRKSQTKRFFCSRSCAASFNNVLSPKRRALRRRCKHCGKRYVCSKNHSSALLCPDCRLLYKGRRVVRNRTTLSDIRQRPSLRGKHPVWFHNYVRGFCRGTNKTLTKLPCQACGYAKHTELCHIRAIADWPETATLGQVNSEKNIVVLCRNCHWELDHNKLDIKSIPLRKEVSAESQIVAPVGFEPTTKKLKISCSDQAELRSG